MKHVKVKGEGAADSEGAIHETPQTTTATNTQNNNNNNNNRVFPISSPFPTPDYYSPSTLAPVPFTSSSIPH